MTKRKEPSSRAVKTEAAAKVSKSPKGGKSVTRSAVTGAVLARSGRLAEHSVTVKVVRNGNGRALPLPAAVLRSVSASVGSQFEVRAVGDDVVFHRLTGDEQGPVTVGSGNDRVFAPSEVAFVGSSPGVALLDDWDF